ncbi:TLD-domain-containing protein [Backusella circina FSU 941]|nr:TLD-domain-containing protein [Backusella circina FSU 941]
MSFYPVMTTSNSTPMTSTTTTPTKEKSNLSSSNSSNSSSSEPEEIDDDASSILSSLSSNCTINSTCSAVSFSAAVDALVSASLLPTKPRRIKFSDFQLPPCIKFENRKEDTTPVMTQNIAELIRPYIPGRHRIASKWTLLYSIDQHGVSLNTIYSSMKNRQGPCIMIIKDTDNQIFGSYQSDVFSCQSNYYGTGECFLWKLSQVEHTKHPMPKIKVFPWTGKNDYMILSDSDEIAIGGGDGEFGLWLHSDLEHGYSHPCATFDNDYLAKHAEFQCLGMEIWGFCI